MVGTLVRGCRCVTSWCDLYLTFDPVKVTMSFKILSGLFTGFHKVKKVDTWYRHWIGGVGVYHAVTFNFDSANVCSPAIFETSFSYDKDIWIAATDYCMHFYIIVRFPLTAILQLINFTAS